LAVLVVVVAFAAAGKLRAIEPDVSVVCHPPYGDANCTESRRSAWIDLSAVFVVLSGLAGAAAILVARRRRTPSWKSLARVYAVCLGISVALYATFVLLVLTLG
jgi:hypothetical protein